MEKNKFLVDEKELKKQKEYTSLVRTVLFSRFSGRRPLAFVHTYGCQGNVSDGERLKGMLSEMGYDFCENIEQADFVLYNTCAIREHAEDLSLIHI